MRLFSNTLIVGTHKNPKHLDDYRIILFGSGTSKRKSKKISEHYSKYYQTIEVSGRIHRFKYFDIDKKNNYSMMKMTATLN